MRRLLRMMFSMFFHCLSLPLSSFTLSLLLSLSLSRTHSHLLLFAVCVCLHFSYFLCFLKVHLNCLHAINLSLAHTLWIIRLTSHRNVHARKHENKQNLPFTYSSRMAKMYSTVLFNYSFVFLRPCWIFSYVVINKLIYELLISLMSIVVRRITADWKT